jgi:hypothetical protein
MLTVPVAAKCLTEHRCAQLITANFTHALMPHGSMPGWTMAADLAGFDLFQQIGTANNV